MAPNIDKIIKSIELFAVEQKVTGELIRKTGEEIRELRLAQNQTDGQIRKTGEEIRELRLAQNQTDGQIRKIGEEIRELRLAQNQTDEQMKKTDEQMKKTDKKILSMAKRLGSLGLTQGEFAEELFYTSFIESPILGDIVFDRIYRNVRTTKNDTEFDIFLLNGTCVGLIEVKYKAHPKDIREIVETKVKAFRKTYTEYENHVLYFGIATTVSNAKMKKEAEKEGIFLLTQKGNRVEIVNSEVRTF